MIEILAVNFLLLFLFNKKCYSLGVIGRYKFNKKLSFIDCIIEIYLG